MVEKEKVWASEFNWHCKLNMRTTHQINILGYTQVIIDKIASPIFAVISLHEYSGIPVLQYNNYISFHWNNLITV